MRCAVVVAPWDPRSSDAGAWSDAVAWLGAALARTGFRVAVVDTAEDVESALSRALAEVGADDTLLVHVSGRLARKGVLRTGGGKWIPLRALGDAVAAHAASDVSILAELVHEDDADDALVAADHVASAVAALEARDRGYGVIAAVRPSTAAIEPMAFTRLLLSVASAAPRDEATFSQVYERLRGSPESVGAAQSFTLVRGRSDLELVTPRSPEELVALVAEATDAKDWGRVLELRRERLRTVRSPRLRVRELVAIARILQAELGDADGAIEALEAARAIDPRRVGVLQALRRGYEMLGRWASAIEVIGGLADVAESPGERAALRYAQAKMALDRLDDEERAAAWLEAVLQDDPSHEIARATLAAIRSSEGEEEEAEVIAEAPADVPAVVPADAPTLPRLPETRQEPESPPAMQLVAPATMPPPPVELSPEPSLEATGDALEVATHARAFDVHRRDGRTDAAFLAALVLEELGAADVDHQVLIEQYRTVAPVRARGSLDAAAWALLRAPGSDEVLDTLFGGVARAAVTARVEQLVARGLMVALDPTTRLEETSTASVVRSFQWASRVLCVPCPSLYMIDHVPGDIAAVRAHEPSTAVGASVVRGRSAKDLAFLAGRHLTYYQPANQVLVYFPSREELTRLFMAAVQLVSGDEEAADDESRAVAALCARIDRHIRDEERAAVAHSVQRLQARGGRASLGKWTRAIELTAGRAGLFLCGDLATATAILGSETRGIAGLSTEQKRRDLIAFCTSSEHAALRERYAHTAPQNQGPRASVASPDSAPPLVRPPV